MTAQHSWPGLLEGLLAGRDLAIGEATWAMQRVMSGEATGAQLAALLVALRAKGESAEELVGFRDAILDAAVALDVPSRVLDIVGTGGDLHRTVNISTTAAIIVAATGIPVLKHGNRAVSSASGASDILAELGVIPASEDPAEVARILREAGISFVWAARFHPGFRHAGPVRAELGIATAFNILGPLVNPARPDVTVAGVSDRSKMPAIAGVFATRGATALLVRGDDGLDELTTTGHSALWEVSRGDTVIHDVDPRELGIPVATIDDLRGGTPAENAAALTDVLAGRPGPVRDVALLNAAAGLVAWRLAEDPESAMEPMVERLRAGLETARQAVDSGAAAQRLDAWRSAAG